MGTSIAYIDVTESHRLQDQLTSSKRELEQAYEELQSTVEELETTNEELQSTNEELETTNEELQSTNEELETMNEELQSTNEELETMNEELRHRTQELNDVNAFLETILTTIGLAVAVLDRNQHVQIWNGKARELWGLTAEEAEDEHLMALDIGLPVDELRQQIRDTLTGESEREEVVLDATNRRGKAFQCRVTFLPLGERRRRRGLGRDHDDGGRRLLTASCEIRSRMAFMRTRAVRIRFSCSRVCCRLCVVLLAQLADRFPQFGVADAGIVRRLGRRRPPRHETPRSSGGSIFAARGAARAAAPAAASLNPGGRSRPPG